MDLEVMDLDTAVGPLSLRSRGPGLLDPISHAADGFAVVGWKSHQGPIGEGG